MIVISKIFFSVPSLFQKVMHHFLDTKKSLLNVLLNDNIINVLREILEAHHLYHSFPTPHLHIILPPRVCACAHRIPLDNPQVITIYAAYTPTVGWMTMKEVPTL
jgi:hypothetical protein